MTSEEILTTELADLDGGEFHKSLMVRRQEIVDAWTASTDEKRDLISKGEKRVLDNIITEIESAKVRIQLRRQPAERAKMSHAF